MMQIFNNNYSARIAPYVRLARLNRPTGIWLLYIPCCFGLLLAQTHSLFLYAIFLVGAVLMRSAGCAINDIIDRKLDAQVERTKDRPLASGEIKVTEALLFLALLLVLALGVLLTLPDTAMFLGFSVVPLIVAYPLMKRITHYPQVFLGLTFNYGVLIGYAAVTNEISLAAVILYVGCIFWTIGYDTIYALQDLEDDLRVGIKSTTIAFGEKLQACVLGSYFVFLLAFAMAAGYAALVSSFTMMAIVMAAMILFWQVAKASPKNPKLCLRLFKANVLVGALLVAGLLF